MTGQPAVLQGTYSDLRFIKGRKVAQLVVEVPLELAGQIVEALGTPDPANPAWVAVARLTGPRSADQWLSLTPRAQSIVRCRESAFWRFLENKYQAEIPNEAAAIKLVAEKFGFGSRFAAAPDAAQEWLALDREYRGSAA